MKLSGRQIHEIIAARKDREKLARLEAHNGESPADRDEATAAISLLAAEAGVAAVRVHDVGRTARAFAVRSAWQGDR